MEWTQCKSLFTWDGSLRDLYVLETTLSDWQRLLDGLRASAYDLQYSVGEQTQLLPERIDDAVLARTDAPWPLLVVDQPVLHLVCHFFQAEQIECDLDPRVIEGDVQLNRLLTFVHTLGGWLGKAVIMTPENSPEQPFYRFDPYTQTDEWFIDD